MPFGDDFDVYPMSGGLSTGDPLIDWGSNLKPEDLQQYLHDPEGFKQRMIEAGQPPPDFHFTSGPDGRPTPLPPGVEPPMIRETPQGFALAPSAPPPAGLPRAITGGGQAGGPALPYTGETSPLEPGPYEGVGGAGYKPRERIGPVTPIREREAPPAPAPAVTPQTGPPVGEVPEIPTPTADPRKALLQTSEQDRAKAEALSTLAKTLQGVQMPKGPPLNPVGTPAAPHHTALSAPNLANILALVGQGGGLPSAAPQLARLLGRG